MRKPSATGSVVIVAVLLAGTAAATPVAYNARSASSSSRVVAVTVPGTAPKPAAPRSGPTQPPRPVPPRWSSINEQPGRCNVAGESLWQAGSGRSLLSSYVDAGGIETYYSQVLIGPSGQAVGFFQWCGAGSPPPPPPSDAYVVNAVRATGRVSLDAIIGTPNEETLAGLETEFMAYVTNIGRVRASNSLWTTEAVITAADFRWKFDENLYASGQNPSVMYQRKGPKTIELSVRFDIQYNVSGPVSYSDNAAFVLSIQKPYLVREARGVLR